MNQYFHIKSWIFILLGMILFSQGCYREQVIIIDQNPYSENVLKINESYGFVDLTEKFILYTIGADTILSFSPKILFSNYTSMTIDGKEIINNRVNDLGDVWINHPYQIITRNEGEIDTFQLYFTRIPLLHITSDETIRNDPKVLSKMSLQFSNDYNDSHSTNTINSYVGIEIRGQSSTRYDKKSFGLELWKNEFEDDYSASLLGMHYGEDWILDAMYIDDLRMRNKISFELWEKLSSVPASDQKPDVVPGIHCEYVELFLNNRYHGIYTLNEKLDENILHYSHNQDIQGGVLYKAEGWGDGGTRFDSIKSSPPDDYYWDGWEQIYPNESVAWNPLDELRHHIVNSSDEEFRAEIESYFDLDNAINYYLFITLLIAMDNTGKNTYLARYTEHSTFFYMPWDIEATWGLFWNRDKMGYTALVINNLFRRLMKTNAGDFNERVQEQWFTLRNNTFSEKELFQAIDEYYELLKNNGVIERENQRWGEFIIDLDAEHDFITQWLKNRLAYLDTHFE